MSVVSVTKYQILLPASTASASANLGSQDMSNCYPILTKRVTTGASDTFTEICVDLEFETGPNRITASTSTAVTRALTCEVSVIEVDGTDLIVNSGTYTMSDTTSDEIDTTAKPGTVGLTDTVLYHYHDHESGSVLYERALVRGRISAEDTLIFDREVASSNVNGHWFTIQATSGFWTVQNKTIEVADLSLSDTATITSVTTGKTFLTGSHSQGTADDTDDSALDIDLTNGTTITATRRNTAGDKSWAGQAVTFAGDSNVYRGTIAGSTTTPETFSIGATIVEADCTIHVAGNCGSVVHGNNSSGSSDGVDDAQCGMTIISTTQGQCDRLRTDSATSDISWEVIEWDIGAASVPRRVMVIS